MGRLSTTECTYLPTNLPPRDGHGHAYKSTSLTRPQCSTFSFCSLGWHGGQHTYKLVRCVVAPVRVFPACSGGM